MSFRRLTLAQRRALREIDRPRAEHRAWSIGLSKEWGGRLVIELKGDYIIMRFGRFHFSSWAFRHGGGRTEIETPFTHFWRAWRPFRRRGWKAYETLGWSKW